MIKQLQPSGKWFVFGWNNLGLLLGGPFDTEEDASDYLETYTDINDPATAR